MSVTSSEPVAIGVGLDTARYGHHASFLREDRQPAAEPLEFLECQAGYQELEKVLSKLAQRHGRIHFHIRVDAASQYATNLLALHYRCGVCRRRSGRSIRRQRAGNRRRGY